MMKYIPFPNEPLLKWDIFGPTCNMPSNLISFPMVNARHFGELLLHLYSEKV